MSIQGAPPPAAADPSRELLRVAAVGDLHVTRASQGGFQAMFAEISAHAHVLALCGDLTDYGTVEEARILAKELTGAVKVPVVAVLGNHDFEGGEPAQVRDVLRDAGVVVLDGDAHEVRGVGFAGVKGFCGGFGRGALGMWGEPVVKQFVQEAVAEALKLESALARLRTVRRVALLHYAPIRDTVVGEPPEIYPYLGSSRLEEPLTRYAVDVVFHGHAHNGQAEGRISSGGRVHNVSLPLLRRISPNRPYLIVEI